MRGNIDALEEVAAELLAAEKTLEEIDTRQREVEREVISATHRHSHMQSELARLGLELTVCQGELARIRADVQSARQRAERARNQHDAAALSRAEAEAVSARLGADLVQLRGSIHSEH